MTLPLKTKQKLGIAFDLGSTTLVGYLCALNEEPAKILGVLSRSNPQIRFGADILSRVSYSARGQREREELQNILGEAVVSMTKQLLSDEPGILSRMILVGNPVILGSIRSYRFPFDDEVSVMALPPIGGYVGADALAASFALEQTRGHRNLLLMDLGTNGEIVLLTDKVKLAASAAAGPAMEGGNISCGMRGEPGAVDQVSLTAGDSMTSDLAFHVMGEEAPRGICGSGLLSLIQTLLQAHAIDNTGYLRSSVEAFSAGCPRKIAERILEHNGRDHERNTGNSFRLTDTILLTQEDIHELQLSVSALRTAVEMLLKEAKLTKEVIDGYHLAGAFGNYITIDSVLRLGILPGVPRERIFQSGNLAGSGGVLCLSLPDPVTAVTDFKKDILTLPLAEKNEFRDEFMAHIDFGDPDNVDR